MDSDSDKRYRRRDYTTEPIKTRDTPIYIGEDKRPRTKAKKNKKKLVLGFVVLLLLAGAVIGYFLVFKQNSNPVPKDIRKSVSFPIYYPDQAKLPSSYTFNLKSINSPQKNAVLYSVSYGNNKKIIFSVQQKPSDDEMQNFTHNYIPLHNEYKAPAGKAEIGAYNNGGKNLQTLVSLSTNSNTWLIITAPHNIDQNQLKQVLNSLKQ